MKIDVIFPPGPVGRVLGVEDASTGASVGTGEWVDLESEGRSGYWALRCELSDQVVDVYEQRKQKS
jgi:hypothetical protein